VLFLYFFVVCLESAHSVCSDGFIAVAAMFSMCFLRVFGLSVELPDLGFFRICNFLAVGMSAYACLHVCVCVI
jgi:hypothetical protein